MDGAEKVKKTGFNFRGGVQPVIILLHIVNQYLIEAFRKKAIIVCGVVRVKELSLNFRGRSQGQEHNTALAVRRKRRAHKKNAKEMVKAENCPE